MIGQAASTEQPASSHTMVGQFGVWAAVLTSICTLVFAAVAIATPARSGPFCAVWGCVPYPYTAVAQFIPGDYFWLIPGMLVALLVIILFTCMHAFAPESKKLFSRIALLFAGAYAIVIIADYFSQFTIVIPSLQSGEVADLTLFTQYNPHGFFIAGEALGYLLMSIAFLFAAPVFVGGRAERVLGWLYGLGFVLAVIAFVALWLIKNDLIAFEVTILMINWVVLIISGLLLSRVFRQAGLFH